MLDDFVPNEAQKRAAVSHYMLSGKPVAQAFMDHAGRYHVNLVQKATERHQFIIFQDGSVYRYDG